MKAMNAKMYNKPDEPEAWELPSLAGLASFSFKINLMICKRKFRELNI